MPGTNLTAACSLGSGTDRRLWWQRGVIYQVYPRSFQDMSGDGVGDIRGVISRLDYLSWLGVDAVWLSPVYPSPMKDFGYDISDYVGIDPIFGTLEDFDRLVEEAHRRGMKVLLDYVPNHTSNEHPWFIESRSSRDNPKRRWYIWRDPAPDGGPPNNWLSQFGGGAWEFDETTGQYYYHAFLAEQPDLNWRDLEVQEAMFDVMRFWLDRGVDGFRIDVLWHVMKDGDFRDDPENPDWVPDQGPYMKLNHQHSCDRPEVHDIVIGMRNVLEEYGEDKLLIGEVYLPVDRLVSYYGVDCGGAHLPFNFQLINLPWDSRVIKPAVDTYESLVPDAGWPNWVLGNHDQHRVASRIGQAQGRVAAMMLLTLRGTPTLYYGDEIGMTDVSVPLERVQDPFERRVPGLGLGRDPQRSPMQWDASPNAGFSDADDTWLPMAEDAESCNVEIQKHDEGSMLTLYRRLISLRRSEGALAVGLYSPLRSEGDVFAYVRKAEASAFVVVLNLGHRPAIYQLGPLHGFIELSTNLDRERESVSGTVSLRANEGLLIRLS